MGVVIHKVKQGTPEWHALRKPLVTASNAYILLSKGLAAALRANLTVFEGNYWTRRGQALEPIARDLYIKHTGLAVEECGFITNTDIPNAGYSPDGYTFEPIGDGMEIVHLIEIKCYKSMKIHRIIDAGKEWIWEAPEAYAQIQFGMMMTEAKTADLVLLDDKTDTFAIIPVERNEVMIERMRKLLNA